MRKQNIHYLSISLFLFTFCAVSFGQESARVAIPTTRISLIPPPGYKLVDNSTLLIFDSLASTITIEESSTSLSELYEYYTGQEYLLRQEFELLNMPQKFDIEGYPGYRLNFHKTYSLVEQKGANIIIFIAGDSSGSFTVALGYPDTVKPTRLEEAITSVQTIHWNRNAPEITPMEMLNFSIDLSENLKVLSSSSDNVFYTRNGLPIDTANVVELFMIKTLPKITGKIPDAEYRKIIDLLLKNVDATVKVTSVLEVNDILLDGVKAIETISNAYWVFSNRPIAVYYTVLFHPLNTIAFIGLSDTMHYDSNLESFKKMTRSLKRKKSSVVELGSCLELMKGRKYSQAEKCYDQELSTNSELVSALLGKADALRLQNKHKSAIEYYNKVILKERLNEDALLGRGKAYVSVKEYTKAFDDFDVAIGLNSKGISGYTERAALYKQLGNNTRAAEDYDKAIALAPDSAHLYFLRGSVSTGDYTKSIEFLSKSIELKKNSAEMYAERAMLYLFQDKFDKAFNDFSSAIRLNPNKYEYYYNRGNIYQRQLKLEEALRDFNKAIALKADHKGSLIGRGETFLQLHNFDSSVADFSKVMTIDSSDWYPIFYRGIAKFLYKKYKDAATDFRLTIKQKDFAEARCWLYFSEYQSAGPFAANTNLKKYFEWNKDDLLDEWTPMVKYMMGEYSKEEVLKNVGKNLKPQIIPTGSSSKEALTCDANFAMGMKMFVTGQKDGAKRLWQKCVDSKMKDVISYYISHICLKLLLK